MSPESALLCIVVAITDGDTLKARCDGEQITVRLAEIDAPEKRQPWGQRSKQNLSLLCYMQQAEIKIQDRDRYGRAVARVICAGLDANAEQVRSGMAWVYRRYSKDPAMIAIETAAKEAKRGLWSDPSPTPPWEWRKLN